MLTVSSPQQQEAAEEGESSENRDLSAQQTVVGWKQLPWNSAKIKNISTKQLTKILQKVKIQKYQITKTWTR